MKDPDTAHVPFEDFKRFELAPGVIATYNVVEKWVALFDRNRWKPTRPEFWPDSELLFPKYLEGTGIGTLSGSYQIPLITNEIEMLERAKAELTPYRQPISWLDEPLPL